MDERDQLLQQWCERLLAAFELEESRVEIDAVLGLAGKAAHAVVRPAAPLTTFIAGYAAGLAAGSGQASEEVAMRSALALALQQCDAAGDRS
jgi:hypothetical protein